VPPEAVLAFTPGYQPLEPLFCNVAAGDATVDSDGNIAEAPGVQLSCDGKPVTLVDGTIKDGWLVTKDFGKIWVSRSGIFVTPEQSDSSHKL
jgi:hypothetical protein